MVNTWNARKQVQDFNDLKQVVKLILMIRLENGAEDMFNGFILPKPRFLFCKRRSVIRKPPGTGGESQITFIKRVFE